MIAPEKVVLVQGKNGGPVYAHEEMDALRRTECLCRSCARCGPCKYGQRLYEICKEADIALSVTRCQHFYYGTPQVKF